MVAKMKIELKVDGSDLDDVLSVFEEPHHKRHENHHHIEEEITVGCFDFLNVLGQALSDFVGHWLH